MQSRITKGTGRQTARAGAANAGSEIATRVSEPENGGLNQFELAYQAIEERLVNCELRPGRYLALQELQDLVGFGRTPVHQAVTRLATDTLIVVHARRGLQIAPIDLARERELLRLRRDMERFVVRLATERSTSTHRNQMLHLKGNLLKERERLTIETFNTIDRRIDRLFLSTAGEPFVENTMRPLHTIFRRIGWLYHAQPSAEGNLLRTIDVHISLLDAVTHRRVDAALAASDQLIDFVDSMFDILEREVEPAKLDCSVGEFGRR